MELTLKCLLALFAVTAIAEVNDNTDVLVFGGTGRLGAPIVRLLVEAGYPVTVFVRSSSDRSRLAGLDVAFIIGDLMDAGSVDKAVKGKQFRFVIDATSRDSSDISFYDTAMQNILYAVAASQVHQFILHGSVGAGDNMQNFPNSGFERMRDLMLAKGRAEKLLRSSGLGYTIIRNGMVQRDGTPATGNARLTENDRVLGGVTRLDLAALTLQCLNQQKCMNKIFHAIDDSI